MISDFFFWGELVQLQKEQNCISISVTQFLQNLVLHVMQFSILIAFVSKPKDCLLCEKVK